MTEVALSALVGEDVPLFGMCDLLLVDDEAKEVRVADYKTGKGYPIGEPEPAYARQLRLYRLLVENSPDYAGYRVVSCENWYVEPEVETREIREPVAVTISDAEVADLEALIDVVWKRICASDYDTNGFEESDEKAEAVANGGRANATKSRALQQAYEKWLVKSITVIVGITDYSYGR